MLLAVLIARDLAVSTKQRTWLRVVTGVVTTFITLADPLAASGWYEHPASNKLFAKTPCGLRAVGRG